MPATVRKRTASSAAIWPPRRPTSATGCVYRLRLKLQGVETQLISATESLAQMEKEWATESARIREQITHFDTLLGEGEPAQGSDKG